jgi:hypothetical protein
MPAMADSGGGRGRIADTVAALWIEARPRALERAALEDAVASLMASELGDEARDEARREAHKRAGALGTFGIPAGSTIARGRQQGLAFNPRYGLVGLIVFPYFLLIELLAPVVELVGIVAVVLGPAFGAVNVLEQWTYDLRGRRAWAVMTRSGFAEKEQAQA